MKPFLLLTALFSLAASAADISGTWKGTAQSEIGNLERTFVFKVEGNKLTGETTSDRFGKSTINDGKIDGDNFSFSINLKVQDDDMKLEYKGKVSGNELKIHVEVPNGIVLDYTAKKVS